MVFKSSHRSWSVAALLSCDWRQAATRLPVFTPAASSTDMNGLLPLFVANRLCDGV
jgi:hypothetical protein